MSDARGFSLFELLYVLAVAGVLAAIAVPSWSAVLSDSRRTAALNAIVGAIQFARSEAVKRAEEVVLCKSGGASRCATDGGWETGWLVFVNLDRDSPPTLDAGEPLIQQHGPLPSAQISANRDAFTFRPFARASTNGTVIYCDSRGSAAARAVIVSTSGRPRISLTTSGGGPLPCPAP
jgi:type IV fimbrial biogenesis protein FimT